MNSINTGWDTLKREEAPYFHFGLSSQNENKERGYNKNNKSDQEKRVRPVQFPLLYSLVIK